MASGPRSEEFPNNYSTAQKSNEHILLLLTLCSERKP